MYKEEHEFRFVCASDALCIATEAVERNRSQVWRLKGSIRRLSYDGLGLPHGNITAILVKSITELELAVGYFGNGPKNFWSAS